MKKRLLLFIMAGIFGLSLSAQEDEGVQSRESMAMDATATQWSFQFAYQWMPQYYSDMINDTTTRPAGMNNYIQLRIVAPIPLGALTILPRLTIRNYENAQGQYGFGNTELFALIIPKFTDWGTGRAGIGPLVTFPGNAKVSKPEWGYGFAAAIVNNTGQWFYGLLFTQSWRGVDPNALPPEESEINPLGIAPFVSYRFGKTGVYLQNADMVALYDWKSGKFYLPFGLRLGKVWVWPKTSLNFYGEYLTSLIYKKWPGSAVQHSFRFNLSLSIPVGKKK
ncbi:hypothetical protein ACFLS7_04375 [Bacteroidota bacterium]